MQARRHHALQVFEHFRPGESFALEEIIKKLRAVTRGAIFGEVQQRFRLPLLSVTGRNLRLALPNQAVVLPCREPSRQRAIHQQQGEQAEPQQRSAPAHPEAPYVFVRVSGEIYVHAHQESRAPTTPAILHWGIAPTLVPNCDEPTNSRTSAPV